MVETPLTSRNAHIANAYWCKKQVIVCFSVCTGDTHSQKLVEYLSVHAQTIQFAIYITIISFHEKLEQVLEWQTTCSVYG